MKILKPESFNCIIEGYEKRNGDGLNKIFNAAIMALKEEDASLWEHYQFVNGFDRFWHKKFEKK